MDGSIRLACGAVFSIPLACVAGIEDLEIGAALSWGETLAQRLSEADRARSQEQASGGPQPAGKKGGKKLVLLSSEQRRY